MSLATEVVPASDEAVARAAAVIRGGGLVAFPTETVYGLGANALDAAAVATIFAAKGRPATNPVIVHVANFCDAANLASMIPPLAAALAVRFCPGPLTFVLPRNQSVPDIVTAGGSTVAVRVPAHPVAQQLLKESGTPIAAPSANRSLCLSPTTAEHVLRGLNGRIDMLLDAGPCPGGLESTVLDMTTHPPTLLRPGLLGVREIEAVIGPIARKPVEQAIARSPGLSQRHYSPTTPVEFASDDGATRVAGLTNAGMRVAWLPFGDVPSAAKNAISIAMPTAAAAYSARLFAALHDLDDANVDRIVVALPPEDDEWLAVHDRLARMSPK